MGRPGPVVPVGQPARAAQAWGRFLGSAGARLFTPIAGVGDEPGMNTARQGRFGFRTLCLAVAGLLLAPLAVAPAGPVRGFTRGDLKRAEVEEATSVDRRPVYFLRTWNGSYGRGNPLGLTAGYRNDLTAAQKIVERLDVLYDEGWRRIVLHTPTGGPPHAVLDSTLEEWWRRSPQWRSTMRQAIRAWKSDHPDAVIGVYMGVRRRNGQPPTDDWLARCLWPLTDAGFEIFAFDATSIKESREIFRTAQSWLRSRGAKAVMEAYPVDRSIGQVEEDWLADTPMVALQRYVERHDPEGEWRFDTATTEVWIGVGRTEPFDEAVLRDQLERGFIPFVYWLNEEDRRAALRIALEYQ